MATPQDRLSDRITKLIAVLLVLGCTPCVAAANEAVRVLDVAAGPSVAVPFEKPTALFRVEAVLVDRDGHRVAGPVAWSLTLRDGRATSLFRLTSENSELRIARPYGLQLPMGDSLLAAADLSGFDDARVRITMVYENADDRVPRLPVRVAAAELEQSPEDEVAAGRVTKSWLWTAPTSGRLVAMSASQFDGASAIVLEDASTDRVVWRENGPSRFAPPAARIAETVRPAIVVDGGRTYRLRVERGEGESVSRGIPVMLFVGRADRGTP